MDNVENSRNNSFKNMNYTVIKPSNASENNFTITLKNTNSIPVHAINKSNVPDVKSKSKNNITFRQKYVKFMKDIKKRKHIKLKDQKTIIPWNASAFWKRRDNGILIEMERLLQLWIDRHSHIMLNDDILFEKANEIFLDLKNKSGSIFESVEFNPDNQWLDEFKGKMLPQKRKIKNIWNSLKYEMERDNKAIKCSSKKQQTKLKQKINITYDKELLKANHMRLSSLERVSEDTCKVSNVIFTYLPIVKLERINMDEMKKIYRIDSDLNDVHDDDINVEEMKTECSLKNDVKCDDSENVLPKNISDDNLNTNEEKIELPLVSDNQANVKDNTLLKKSSNQDNVLLFNNDINIDRVKIESSLESDNQTVAIESTSLENVSDDINIEKVKVEISLESNNKTIDKDNILLKKQFDEINTYEVKIESFRNSDNLKVNDNIQLKKISENNFTLLLSNDNLNNKKQQQVREKDLEINSCKKKSNILYKIIKKNPEIPIIYSGKSKPTLENVNIHTEDEKEKNFFDSIKPHIEKLENIAGLNFYSHLWDEMR